MACQTNSVLDFTACSFLGCKSVFLNADGHSCCLYHSSCWVLGYCIFVLECVLSSSVWPLCWPNCPLNWWPIRLQSHCVIRLLATGCYSLCLMWTMVLPVFTLSWERFMSTWFPTAKFQAVSSAFSNMIVEWPACLASVCLALQPPTFICTPEQHQLEDLQALAAKGMVEVGLDNRK